MLSTMPTSETLAEIPPIDTSLRTSSNNDIMQNRLTGVVSLDEELRRIPLFHVAATLYAHDRTLWPTWKLIRFERRFKPGSYDVEGEYIVIDCNIDPPPSDLVDLVRSWGPDSLNVDGAQIVAEWKLG